MDAAFHGWTLELPEGFDEAPLKYQQLRTLVGQEDLAAGLNEAVRAKLQDPS